MKLLSYAAVGRQDVCSQLVAEGGLKPLFGVLLRIGLPSSPDDTDLDFHTLSLINHLLRQLADDDRIRVTAKFLEKQAQKTHRLVPPTHLLLTFRSLLDIYQVYGTRLQDADDDDFLVKCDAGLEVACMAVRVLMALTRTVFAVGSSLAAFSIF
ncbi:MAG: hypothetical protein KVP17_000932 [Porospora cf. gigantea B]|uniref:uncharacterized protein n=1 Tax=Porospora cf. gigantea B TaxID=2853592 RepID=UPI003571F6A0|nr:MAG: hypothetical protein KVP17_000932 [Porospora cf. gigantea B]